MRPTLQHTAPSRRLLRFLRSQSEGVPFFVAHHGHVHSHTLAQASGICREQSRRLGLAGPATLISVAPKLAPKPKPLSRPFSSSRPRWPESVVPSHTFNLENILPRHLKRVRSPNLYLSATNSVAASRWFVSSEDTDDGTRKKTSSERLWGPNAVKPDFQSQNTEELEGSIFTSSMGRRAKAALEPVLRCTEVDEKGDAILTDGAFKKTELIAKVSYDCNLQRHLNVPTCLLTVVRYCSTALCPVIYARSIPPIYRTCSLGPLPFSSTCSICAC